LTLVLLAFGYGLDNTAALLTTKLFVHTQARLQVYMHGRWKLHVVRRHQRHCSLTSCFRITTSIMFDVTRSTVEDKTRNSQSPGDEIPERDVTSPYLFTYLRSSIDDRKNYKKNLNRTTHQLP